LCANADILVIHKPAYFIIVYLFAGCKLQTNCCKQRTWVVWKFIFRVHRTL